MQESELLERFRKLYSEVLSDVDHLVIDAKLENDKYIYLRLIDSRYGVDFSKRYFSNRTFGWSTIYVYHKETGEIEHQQHFSASLLNFFSQEDIDAGFPQVTASNLQKSMMKYGVIEEEHLYQMYLNAGMDPSYFWRMPQSRSLDGEVAYWMQEASFGDSEMDADSRKKFFTAFISEMQRLGVNYTLRDGNLFILKRYKPQV